MQADKVKVTIPVVVAQNGEIHTGWFAAVPGSKSGSGADLAYECFTDKGYASGTQVVHIEAEIDVAALFEKHTIQGEVKEGDDGS